MVKIAHSTGKCEMRNSTARKCRGTEFFFHSFYNPSNVENAEARNFSFFLRQDEMQSYSNK